MIRIIKERYCFNDELEETRGHWEEQKNGRQYIKGDGSKGGFYPYVGNKQQNLNQKIHINLPTKKQINDVPVPQIAGGQRNLGKKIGRKLSDKTIELARKARKAKEEKQAETERKKREKEEKSKDIDLNYVIRLEAGKRIFGSGIQADKNEKMLRDNLKGKYSTLQLNKIIENTKNGKLSHNHKLNGDIWCFHVTITGGTHLRGKWRVEYDIKTGEIKDINDKHK
jgi:hypothetical protein